MSWLSAQRHRSDRQYPRALDFSESRAERGTGTGVRGEARVYLSNYMLVVRNLQQPGAKRPASSVSYLPTFSTFKRAGGFFVRTTLLAVAIALVVSILPVSAQAVTNHYPLNIPRQPLDAALKDLARQTGVQIARFSDIPKGGTPVVGPLTGDMSVGQALTAILKKTGLTYRVVNDRTIAVVAPGAGTAESAGVPPDKHASDLSAGANGSGEGADGQKAFWNSFLVAQADQGGGSSSASEDQQRQRRSKEESNLQEVVVTAQKRAERLQDVPISISVLSGVALDQSTTQGVLDELGRVPGVVVLPQGIGFGSQEIAIRGVSASGTLNGGASTAAYYLDTVPFGFILHAEVPDSGSFDLKRIEVLRGPQGTLYGANAENGVVRIIPNAPDLNAFGLKARVLSSVTQYGGPNAGGDLAVNVPIIDGQLAVRGVVGYQDLSGWIDRPNDNKANDAQLRNYRVALGYQPLDALSIELSAWSSRDDFGAPNFSLPNRTAPDSGPDPEPLNTSFDAYGAKITYQFSHVTVTSQTSYVGFNTYGTDSLSPFGPVIPILALSSIPTTDTSYLWSEEFLLNSKDMGPWRYTAGVFYRDDRDHYQQDCTGPFGDFCVVGYRGQSRSYAFFGELSRRFLDDKLEWTLGLRQFHDDVTALNTIPPAPAVKDSFNATTPRIVLSWYPSKEMTVYSSFSEGYRSGYPALYFLTQIDPNFPSLKPDKLYNYELGTKADLFGHHLLIDTSVYYIRWVDVQQPLGIANPKGGYLGGIANGNSASGPGVDFAVTARPLDALQVGATISWNNLEQDTDVYSGGAILFPKGSRLPNSSKYTGSLFATYSFPLGSPDTSGEFSVSGNYISGQPSYSQGLQGGFVTTYGDNLAFLNAAFTVNFPNNWSMKLYGDNLTNEYGVITSLVGPGAPPSFAELAGRPRPRTVGLQVDYRYR